MEAEARYTCVGAGGIALIAALVGAVVWLKRVGSEQDLRRYTVYFERQRLDGLQIGGDVDMRGIKIGRVDSYALADRRVAGDEVNRVRVTIRVDRHARVRINTVAVVTRNFVTGIAQITLVTPEPAGSPLESAPPGEPYPVIAEGRSDLDEIAGRVGQLGDMAAEVTTDLNRAMALDKCSVFAYTPNHRRKPTAVLNRRLDGFDRALASTRSIAYARSPGAREFYQLASWTEPPLAAITRLLQQRLEARATAEAVGLLGQPIAGDWLLAIGVEAVYHDVAAEPGTARLVLRAELIDRRARTLAARRTFEAAVPVERAASAAAAAALDRAVADIFDALVPWLEEQLARAASAPRAATR